MEPELRAPLLPGTAAECQNGEQQLRSSDAHGPDTPAAAGEATSPWPLTTALLLGDMFGLGALTLPADFAQLGWGGALGAIALCAVGMCYSGVLFARLATAFPRTMVFDEFGRAAFGKNGQRLVYVTIYACILITPVIFQITIVESVLTMLGPDRLSALTAHLLVFAVMLPLVQVRHLEEVGWLSLGGTLSMVAVVAIAFVKILLLQPGSLQQSGGGSSWAKGGEPSNPPSLAASDVRLGLVAFMDVVFSYGGAANWLRYITGMQQRAHFTRVASTGSAFMTLCYVALGAAGYARLGQNFDRSKPITSVLPYDGWTVAANAALLLHCVVAYQININVWTDLVLHLLSRARGALGAEEENAEVAREEAGGGRAGWLAWGAASATGLGFCLLVGATFPYFTIVVALISSVGDLAAAYALPALFSLKLLKLPRWERWLCIALVPAAFGLSGVGMYSSLSALIDKVGSRGG